MRTTASVTLISPNVASHLPYPTGHFSSITYIRFYISNRWHPRPFPLPLPPPMHPSEYIYSKRAPHQPTELKIIAHPSTSYHILLTHSLTRSPLCPLQWPKYCHHSHSTCENRTTHGAGADGGGTFSSDLLSLHSLAHLPCCH